MSIVRMRKVFRGRKKVKIGKKMHSLPSPAEAVFYLIILIFIAGAYYTFGGPGGRSGSKGGENEARVVVTSVVARVNGEKISRQLYDLNLMNREQMMGSEMDLTQERYVRSGLLNSLIDAALMRQAAKKENIRVTSADLNAEREKQLDQEIARRFPDEKSKVRFLRKENKTLDQYKASLRNEMLKDTESLREQVARDKLQKAIEAKVTMSDADLTANYDEMQVSHILISSEKEVTRAKEAAKKAGQPEPAVDGDALAKKKADAILAQIKGGADFGKLAKENSDDPGSASKNGVLELRPNDPWIKRSDSLVKEFLDAAFALQPNQVSEVVKTQFGYHIIKVTARRNNLPKDFAKNKETYRQQALAEKKSRAWADYQDNLKKTGKIEILDPELRAYKALDENKDAEALQALEEANRKDPKNAVVSWELAQLYEKAKQPQKAIEQLELVATGDGASNPMVHLKLGDLYLATNNKAKALPEYQDAFDRASAFTMQNFMAVMQVEQKLKSLGDTQKLAEIEKWLADYREQQKNNPMGGMGGMGGPMGNFQIPAQ